MARLCLACGKASARYRVTYDPILAEAAVHRGRPESKTCAWCLRCGGKEARRRTAERRAREDRLSRLDMKARTAWRSDVQLPRDWQTRIDKVLCEDHGRFSERATGGGAIRRQWRERYLFLEIVPPPKRPRTWSPQAALYALRYRTRLPLVFVPVPLLHSPCSGARELYSGLPIVLSESDGGTS